jgi:hypothetical protein
MSVQAFSFYNKAKKYISGTINLGSTSFFAHLITSAGNFATKTLSTLGSLTSEVASGNGYKKSGKALTSVTWSTGASAAQEKFTSAAFVWTATGGTIPNVKGLVIVARTGASAKDGANKLLTYASLSSGQFTISQNNTLTITPNASGIFTLA